MGSLFNHPTLPTGSLFDGSSSGLINPAPQPASFNLTFGQCLNRRQRHHRPLVIMFIGRRGEGKTLAMTRWAYNMAALYRHAKAFQMRIACNYYMDFAHLSSPYLPEALMTFPPWGRDLLVCYDEITSLVPSRRTTSRMNLNFGNWLMQIRKRNVSVLMATQFPQVIDRLVLHQTDLFIHCELINGGQAVRHYVHDWWGQWTGKQFTKPWPPIQDMYDYEWVLPNTDAMFDRFRSSEVVPSNWIPQRDAILYGEGWRLPESGDTVTEPIETVAMETPPNGEEVLRDWVGKLGTSFNPKDHLATFKDLNSDLKNVKQINEWLHNEGYIVTKLTDGTWLAHMERPKAGYRKAA
jgi:hypothetical protein